MSSLAAPATLTLTGNVGAAVTATFTSAAAAATKSSVAAQSLFDPSHPNPVTYSSSDPLALFIVQAFIIVALSRLLHLGLSRLRQPMVISEIVAGILLGPSVMGRVPHFTDSIFPTASIPHLTLVSTIGLVLFLFMVGMEVDWSLFKRNVRLSGSISVVGMIIPFALGAAVSRGVYDNFIDTETVKFGTFLLFIGTANAITAFPVLARILTDQNLLRDPLGVVVLSAGVGNDVVGWVLLALAVALVNASSGIIILYIILTAIGWILALWFIGRPVLVWLCRKTGSYGENGPTLTMTTAVLFLVLTSAWITDRIGIHAIFGGFVAGLVIPYEIRAPLTEKIEDLVASLFLPIYFVLSGLKTNLGLLSDGSIWGWTMCVIFVAFFSKFLSSGAMGKTNGLNWRESGAVGSLMACKGLVELIVLNIGLSAGILNNQVFAMFVLMALVTTFVTTPLTLAFYPASYRAKRELERRGTAPDALDSSGDSDDQRAHSKLAIVLDRLDQLPAVFAFVRLFKPHAATAASSPAATRPQSYVDEKKADPDYAPAEGSQSGGPGTVVSIDGLRLVELSDRTSALIKAADSEGSLKASDTLGQVFRTFALGHGMPTTLSMSIIQQDQHADRVAEHAAEKGSDLVVIPWALQTAKVEEGVIAGLLPNPFEGVFGKAPASREGSPQYAAFVRKVFAEAGTDVALYLDRGLAESAPALSGRTHLFLAFHGGADDRVALALLVQLTVQNPNVRATVVRVERAAERTAADKEVLSKEPTMEGSTAEILPSQFTVQGGGGAVDTAYPTVHGLGSETADNLALAHWFEGKASHSAEVKAGLERVSFSTVSSAVPLAMAVARARAVATGSDTPLVVLAGRGRRDAASHAKELEEVLKRNLDSVAGGIARSSEVRRGLGVAGVAYLVEGVGAGVLVVQSGRGLKGRHSRAV